MRDLGGGREPRRDEGVVDDCALDVHLGYSSRGRVSTSQQAACRRQLKTEQGAAVSSSDQRKDGGLEDLVWSLPSQCLSRPVVDLGDHGEQVFGAVRGQVGLLRDHAASLGQTGGLPCAWRIVLAADAFLPFNKPSRAVERVLGREAS